MPQIIEVPGMGQVSFPDGMTDADISTAIQRNLPRSTPPSAVGLMAQQAMDAETAAQNAPSMGGSFIREAARSVGPGLAGMAAGSASGAALGAAGLNPLTVALGAVAGGVTGFMGARKISDVAFDAMAPDSFMGTKSAEQDMEANKWSTMLGGAIGGGGAPGPLRGVMAIPRLMTAEGRQVLGTGLRQGATVAARQASNDILEPIVGAGVGVGLGAAHGADGAGMAEQAGLGLLFNRGWHNVLRAKPPIPSTDTQHGVQGDPATGSPAGVGVVPLETNAAVVTPTGPLKAAGTTRLAADLAGRAGLDPLALVPSGDNATVTPNDVRAAGAKLPALTQDSGGTLVINPPRQPEASITDLIGRPVKWEGIDGTLVNDGGRPHLQTADGGLVELPFSYHTDSSITELGITPTGDRAVDRQAITRTFGDDEGGAMHQIFSRISTVTDDILDIAELGASTRSQKGKKGVPVRDTPEFAQHSKGLTDEALLVAREETQAALTDAESHPTLSNDTREAITAKLRGDLENIDALVAARDTWQRQRLPLPTSGLEAPSQRATLAAADATRNRAAAVSELNGLTPRRPVAEVPPVETPPPAVVPVTPDPVVPVSETLQKGDRFTDSEGTQWEVWMTRQGNLQAHPVVDGKTVVNNQSGKMWATTGESQQRNPTYRTDITDVVAKPPESPIVPVAVEPPAAVPTDTATPAARELSARTRANKLKAEVADIGQQIMAQRQKIDQMKKDGKLPRGISNNEKKLSALQDLQNQKKASLAETKAEIPRFVKTLSTAANNILRAVDDSLSSFPGFNSLKDVGTRIKMPSPQLALILGKLSSGTPLSSREKNFLAFNKKGGEYDGYIKLSDIDNMPGTPAGREAAKHYLKSIYDTHDSTTASGPDNAVAGKSAHDLWAELRSEVEDIARGKTRDATDALDAIHDRQERQLIEFDKAVEEAPATSKTTPDELGLEKGDTLTIDGEPLKVIAANDESVTLRDHDKFGDQKVSNDTAIPAENVESQAKARLADEAPDAIAADEAATRRQAEEHEAEKPAPADDFALKPHESDAEIKAEQAAAKQKEELAKRQAAPLKGSAGDLTPDIFGEGDTPLFNERRDTPKQKSIIDGLKAHQDEVKGWIKGEQKSGRMNSMPIDILGAQAYDAALTSVIKLMETGVRIGKAVRTVIADIKKTRQLSRDEEATIKAALIAKSQDHLRFAGERDAKLMHEMPKIAEELVAQGKTPTQQDLIAALAARFPDQAPYIRANGDKIFKDMMFARDTRLSRTTDSQREWGEWADSAIGGTRKLIDSFTKGAPLTNAKQFATSFHATYMTGIGNKMRHLAEGNITGNKSNAWGKWTEDLVGLAKGKDGVHRVSTDLEMNRDVTTFANHLDRIKTDLNPMLNAMPRGERKAFMERVGDHITDASRDGELANQPELKRAVEAYVKIREDLLKHMKDSGVEVGDVGPRSMRRVLDRQTILGNKDEFVKQAANAYKAKWRTETAKLNAEAAGLDPIKNKARLASIQTELKEIAGRDATDSAKKYLLNIEADEVGITSDGNDLFSHGKGNPSSIKSREFGAEADQLLGKFYLRDPDAILRREIGDSVRAAGVARTFSGPALDPQGNPRPNGEIDPMAKWKKLRQDLIEEGNADMIPMAATLLKEHFNLGGQDNPSMRTALEIAHTHTQLAFLARSAFSSLGEPALAGIRAGSLRAIGEGYVKTFKGMARELRGLGPDEARIVSNAIGTSNDGFNSILAANRFLDSNAMAGKSGELVAMFHAKTWLTALTNATHAASVDISHGFIRSQLELRQAGGKFKTVAGKHLNEIGITTADIPAMLKFSDDFAKSTDKVKLLTADTPEAKMYRDALHLVRMSGGSLHVLRGTRPQHANSPVGGMFYALKSFLFAFQDQVLSRHARLMKTAVSGETMVDGAMEKLSTAERTKMIGETAKAVATLAAAQYGIQVLRESLFSDPARMKEEGKTPAEKARMRAYSVATRSSFFGGYDILFNAFTGARHGGDPSTAVLGPTGGLAGSIIGQVAGIGGKKDSPNTNTHERKLARSVWDFAAKPLANAAAATLPGYKVATPLIQAFNHPGPREALVKTVAGAPMKGGPMKKKSTGF